MPYDYTRVRVGDTVRDDQTLKEGRIIDIQMVGQWIAFVTVLYTADGIRKEYPAIVKGAPEGLDAAAAQRDGRTPAPSGQELELHFDTTTSGVKLDVVRRVTEAESSAAQAARAGTQKTAAGPVFKLRKFVDDLYTGNIRGVPSAYTVTEYGPATDARPSVDKSAITKLLDEMEERAGPKGTGGILDDIVNAVNSPVASTPAKQVEKVLSTLPSAQTNKEATRELAKILVSAEKRSGLVSGKMGAAKGVQAASALSRALASGQSVSRDFITQYDPGGRSINKAYQNLRGLNRMWGSVLSDPEKTILGTHHALEVARAYGLVDDATSKQLLTNLTDTFGRGSRGAYRFYGLRSEFQKIADRMQRQISGMSLMDSNPRGYVAETLSQLDLHDSPLSTVQMSDDAYERAEAYKSIEGHIAASRKAADEIAHAQGTLNKIGIVGKDEKLGRLVTAAEEARKALAYGNVVERNWLGMRFSILDIPTDEHGRPRVKAKPAASRVLDAEGFELLMNIRLNGRNPHEALRSTLIDALSASFDDETFLGLREMFAEGGSAYGGKLPNQAISEISKELYRREHYTGPFSIAGQKFESIGSFLSYATGTDEASAWQSFQRKVMGAVKGERTHIPVPDPMSGVTRLGQQVVELREEAVQNALVAYDMALRRSNASTIKEANEEAMAKAVRAAANPRFRKVPGLSLDEMLGSGTLDAAMSQTQNAIPDLIEQIESQAAMRNRKAALVLSRKLKLDPLLVETLLNDTADEHADIIARNLRTIGIKDDELIDAFINKDKSILHREGLKALGLSDDLARAIAQRDDAIARKLLTQSTQKKLLAAGVERESLNAVMGGSIKFLPAATRRKAAKILETHTARMAGSLPLSSYLVMDLPTQAKNTVTRLLSDDKYLFQFLPATRRRMAATYYNAGIFGVLPQDTIKRVMRVMEDDATLDNLFGKIQRKEAGAVAQQIVDQHLFSGRVPEARGFGQTIAESQPDNILAGLRALGEVFAEVTADDDYVRVPLTASGFNALRLDDGALAGLFQVSGIGRMSEVTVNGSLKSGLQVAKNGRVYTIADVESLVDERRDVFVTNPDIIYTHLPADVLLPENMGKLADTAGAATDKYVQHLSDSPFYTLPGHGQGGLHLLSTGDSQEAFARQIQTLKEMAEGKHRDLYVLDIEANPVTGEILTRPDRPHGIHEVGYVKAAPQELDGRWTYKPVDEGRRFVAGMGYDEKGLISSVSDLIKSANQENPIVVATHYKPYDFPAMIERATAHGMSEEASILENAFKGLNPYVRHIDTMLAGQLASPDMRSFSVESAAKNLRLRGPDWKEAHTTIEDDLAELDILNKGLIQGRKNIEHLAAQTTRAEMGMDTFLWRSQGAGGDKGRLFRVLGNFQTPDMAEQSLSGILLREMKLGPNGELMALAGGPIAEINAAHMLGNALSGKYVPVDAAAGRGLLSETVADLGGRIVRDMMGNADRPALEAARLRAIKNSGVTFPSFTDCEADLYNHYVENGLNLDLLPHSGKIESYRTAEKTAFWMEQHGRDWRRRAQTEMFASDWLEGEYKAVHEPFYNYVKGLDIDKARKDELIRQWHERMNPVLGDFVEATAEVRPFARQLSVDLPGIGAFGFNIGSSSQLQESINRAASRYSKHLDAVEASRIVGKHATPEQMRRYFSSGQEISTLPYAAQDALRDYVWDDVAFPAFQKSRTEFAQRVTVQADKDLIADALSSSHALRTRVLDIGARPEDYSPQVAAMLSARDYTAYRSRVTPVTVTADILKARDETLAHFRDRWQTIAPEAPFATSADIIPNSPFFYSNLRGKSVDEVIRHYEEQAKAQVGNGFDTAYDAIQHGRKTARNVLGQVFADEEAWGQLGEPVQNQILTMFGFPSYTDPKAIRFRDRTSGNWDFSKEEARAELSGRISTFGDKMSGIASPEDLAGIMDPLHPERDLGDYSASDLRGIARDSRLPIDTRERLLDLATDVSSRTSGGLSSGLQVVDGFVPATVSTKHAIARASVENAAEYLATAATPRVRLAVAAIGTAAALFVARKPNVQPEEERMSAKQRFERQIKTTEKPLYFRIQARITGAMEPGSGTSEDDLVSGAREAVTAHMEGGTKNVSQIVSDGRKKLTNRVLDGFASRLSNALYPINDQ